MQSHDVHHGVVSEISVYQIQCWLSSPRGESLSLSLCLNSFGGPGGNLAASHSALRYALITASLTPE